MAVVDDKIVVPPDSEAVGAKAVDNVLVSTAAGPVRRQGITLSDPENPDARTKISDHLPPPDAYGATTREAAPGFDSGPTLLGLAYAPIPAMGTVKATGVFLSNQTGGVRAFFLKDANGKIYFNGHNIQAFRSEFVPLGRITFIGDGEWHTDQADGVLAQFVGEK